MELAHARCAGIDISKSDAKICPVRAIVAVQHAMLIAIWRMGTTGTLYDDPEGDFYTRLHPERAKTRAVEQLRSLGYQVILGGAG